MLKWTLYKKSKDAKASYRFKRALNNLLDFRDWSLAVEHINKKVHDELNRNEFQQVSGYATQSIQARLDMIDCDEVNSITRKI